MSDFVDTLAAYIRQIDGAHTLGAAQLAEKIVERFTVVELPVPANPDADGQAYYDDVELRVDHSGTSGPTIHHYNGYDYLTPGWLRAQAVEYLAAARDAGAPDGAQ